MSSPRTSNNRRRGTIQSNIELEGFVSNRIEWIYCWDYVWYYLFRYCLFPCSSLVCFLFDSLHNLSRNLTDILSLIACAVVIYNVSAHTLLDRDFVFDRIFFWILPYWLIIHLSYFPFVFPGNLSYWFGIVDFDSTGFEGWRLDFDWTSSGLKVHDNGSSVLYLIVTLMGLLSFLVVGVLVQLQTLYRLGMNFNFSLRFDVYFCREVTSLFVVIFCVFCGSVWNLYDRSGRKKVSNSFAPLSNWTLVFPLSCMLGTHLSILTE